MKDPSYFGLLARLTGRTIESVREEFRERRDADERAEAEAKARRAAELLDARRERFRGYGLHLPAQCLQALADDRLRATEPLRVVRAWSKSNAGGLLVLCGPPGCGKSVAAAFALWHVPGEFIPARELAGRVDPWRSDLERGVRRLALDSPGLVVVDDLGTELDDSHGRSRTAIDAFFDARLHVGRTIVTTNLSAEALGARYGGRVASRLKAAHVRELHAGDLRGQK